VPGPWDLKKAATENTDVLFRSIRRLTASSFTLGGLHLSGEEIPELQLQATYWKSLPNLNSPDSFRQACPISSNKISGEDLAELPAMR